MWTPYVQNAKGPKQNVVPCHLTALCQRRLGCYRCRIIPMMVPMVPGTELDRSWMSLYRILGATCEFVGRPSSWINSIQVLTLASKKRPFCLDINSDASPYFCVSNQLKYHTPTQLCAVLPWVPWCPLKLVISLKFGTPFVSVPRFLYYAPMTFQEPLQVMELGWSPRESPMNHGYPMNISDAISWKMSIQVHEHRWI